MSADPHPQWTLDPQSFHAIAELAYRESGLTLVERKATMIQSRLRQRLLALGLSDFATYSRFVSSPSGVDERRQLISALTTNVSHFFREAHHFETLREAVRAAEPDLRAGGRFRIWSAGCANGQETLSAALEIADTLPQVCGRDLRILGTDIDPRVIQFARKGAFSARHLGTLPQHLLDRYFRPISEDTLQVDPGILAMIRYRELNLLADWPMKHPFDAIFCRNVVIYFDAQTQARLWPRFRERLKPGGLLMLGHSERISAPGDHGFAAIGDTTYRAI